MFWLGDRDSEYVWGDLAVVVGGGIEQRGRRGPGMRYVVAIRLQDVQSRSQGTSAHNGVAAQRWHNASSNKTITKHDKHSLLLDNAADFKSR